MAKSWPRITKRFIFFTLLLSWVFLLFGSQAQRVQGAPILPAGFVLEPVVTGLSGGVGFDFAPDGRIFIGLKRGEVRVVENGTMLPTPFIDISDQVNNTGDRGMLGIAVHPEFPTQPYVYLLYTYDPPELAGAGGLAGPDQAGNRVSRLMRVEADPAQGYNVAKAGTSVILMGTNSTAANIGDPNTYANGAPPSCDNSGTPIQDCIPADERSHTIGTLRFGLDGSLFVGSGDASSFVGVDQRALRALDLDSMAGKVFRIHPISGDGYFDNPFYDGDPESNRSKVYSYGLRNPFRFTIHPTTGEPFIGDVGWGTWEEINTGRGANFGWPCYEGGNGTPLVQPSYSGLTGCDPWVADPGQITAATFAYNRSGTGSSIQMGDFYTGSAYPAQYQGALFYSDINQQWIEYVTFDGSGNVTGNALFAEDVGGITQMIAGPDTNLYLMNIYTGELSRLRYNAGGNTPPTAVAEATPFSGNAPLEVTFTGSNSYDPDGDPIEYSWDFDDGTAVVTTTNPVHTFTTNGTYNVQLTVDDGNDTHTDSVTITVGNNAPVAAITSPANGTTYNTGDTINFTGTGTDIEDGALTGASLEWEVFVHHNDHIHFDYFHGTGTSGSFDYLDHEDNTYLELCLTVTDTGGLQDSDCIDLDLNEVVYTFETEPTGLKIAYSGVEYTAPFTVTTYVSGTRSVNALTQDGWVFQDWSNGGDKSHDIVIGSTPITLTATFVDMLGHWPLDDGPGSGVAADVSGQGNDGTLTDMDVNGDWVAPTTGTTFTNTHALDFDGNNDHVAIGPDSALDLSHGEFTQMLWLYSRHTDNAYHGVLGYQPAAGTAERFPGIWVYQQTRIHAGFGDGTAWNAFSTGNVITPNTWHHVALTFDGTDYKVYVDGSEVFTTNAHAGKTPYPTQQFDLGRVDNYFDGQLDDVRIFARALTPAEIVSYANGNEEPELELTVNTEGSGSVVINPDKAVYAEDEPVELTANPDSGSVFVGWSGDLGGNSNPANIVMDRPKLITAIFNSAPTLANPGNQTNDEGDVVSLNVAASDAENDTLTFSAANLPSNLAIDPATGEIAGNLTLVSAGAYSVSVDVSDGQLTDTVAFDWVVNNVSQPPQITTPMMQSDFVSETVSLMIDAIDPDGDPITYTASGYPTGLSINATTGEISGTLTETGLFSVTVRAADATGSSETSFIWLVSEVVADYRDDFQGTTPAPGWAYQWNISGTIGTAANYTDLVWNPGYNRYDIDGTGSFPDPDQGFTWGSLNANGGHPGSAQGQRGQATARHAIAGFTVSTAGYYSISDSFIVMNNGCSAGGTVSVYVNDELVRTIAFDEQVNTSFDGTIGNLQSGDTVYVTAGPGPNDACDGFQWDYSIGLAPTTTTAVADFRDDFSTPTPLSGWRYLTNGLGSIGTAANYEELQWNGNGQYDIDGDAGYPDGGFYTAITANGGHPGPGTGDGQPVDRYAIAAYTVANAGVYNLTNGYVTDNNATCGNGATVNVYINDTLVQSLTYADGGSVVLDQVLGSLQAGDTVYVAVGPNGADPCDGFLMDFTISDLSVTPTAVTLGQVGASTSQTGAGLVMSLAVALVWLTLLTLGAARVRRVRVAQKHRD